VIGVVVALGLVVTENDLRLLLADDLDDLSDGLVGICVAERVRMFVGTGIRHARVAVPQVIDLFDAEDRAGGLEFRLADLVHLFFDAGLVHGRVKDVALFPAGAAHEHDAYAFSRVLRHGAGPLGRLVIGMRVDGH
jgi:hypothetical protein